MKACHKRHSLKGRLCPNNNLLPKAEKVPILIQINVMAKQDSLDFHLGPNQIIEHTSFTILLHVGHYLWKAALSSFIIFLILNYLTR